MIRKIDFKFLSLNKILFIFFIAMLAFFVPNVNMAKSQSFTVPIKLMHAYQKGEVSMGNGALNPVAEVTETDKGVDITLTFKPLDFMNMHGHLLKMYSWDGEPKAQPDNTLHEAVVKEEQEDKGLDGKLAKFPSKVVIHRDKLREDQIFVRVRVDAMDSLSGGEGKGEQNAMLSLDYSSAPKSESTSSTQTKSEKNNTTTQNTKNSIDISTLKDGKYTVKINLWHMYEDRPSMGNNGVNELALIEKKGNDVSLTLTVRPLQVSGVTASVITWDYTDKDGNMKPAEVVAKDLEGGKPSEFKFPIFSGEEYLHCKVNPNVDAMGNKPVDARLKFYWDTLTPVANDYKLTGDSKMFYSDVFTPAVDITDEATKIRLQAEERVLASGVKMKIEVISSGDIYEKAKQFFGRQGQKFTLYNIKLVDDKGNTVQPIREVTVTFPTNDKNAVAYHFSNEGVANQLNGSYANDGLKVILNHFSYYAVAEKNNSISSLLPYIIGILVLIVLVIGGFIFKNKKAKTKAMIILGLVFFGAGSISLAKSEDLPYGASLVEIYGSYLNPETGQTEDGGTQNADIGEGMVDGVVTPSNPAGGIDSVFGKDKPDKEHYADALVERRLDGKYFATVRLYLMNFIKFSEKDGPFIQVQQPDGQYKNVEYAITKSLGEKNGVNYNDFRFEVPNKDFKCKVQMFVNPMGRPVKYFVVSTGKHKEGSGDFADYFVQEDNAYKKSQQVKNIVIILVVAVGVVSAAVVSYFVVKKKKENKNEA